MKFLLSTPRTVVRFIKLKSPTARERYAPKWGTLQQPIGTEHRQAGVLSAACSRSCWRITPNFFFSVLPSLLISMLMEYSDWMWEWLYCHSVALTLSPPLVILVRERKLWLTPGRNPLAAAIYREGTQSHLHLELMRDRKTAREWERSMKDTVKFWNK